MKKKVNTPPCPYKAECIIKSYVDGKETVYQCEVCSKIIKIE
jgi:hypothetical protein